MKNSIENSLAELKKCIKYAGIKSGSLHDFNKTKAQYYHNLGKSKLNELLGHVNGLEKTDTVLEAANLLLETIDLYSNNPDQEELNKRIERLEQLFDNIDFKEKQNFKFELPPIPAVIKSELLSDIKEMQLCFDSGCYKAAVILSAKILETALHRMYYEKTSKDLMETSPGIGLGKMVAKLSEHGIELGPGINEQIHLINKVRISSVHKQSKVFNPSKEQAHATILFTIDILNKIFKKD
ncbi:DUF4145 domain-containing protein [Candidatus Woesearchaeota archaeon]|nr:DUF4145 domain-containing protein [Candidatus Woesearchaeota archaeon]